MPIERWAFFAIGVPMKKDRVKDRKHLEFVSELECCVKDISCQGPTQAHHLMKPWVGGRGMGMRADDRNAVPLCFFHHSQLHTKFGNEFKFFARYFRSETFGQELAKSLYENK